MRNATKIAGGFAVAALVAATGSAFTGTGLATSGTAASAQFVGGTVSQTVTGATLTDISYGFTDTTDTAVNSISLTFSGTADGRTVAVAPSGGSGATFTCTAVASNSSTCSPDTAGTSYTGLTSLAVTVS
jgi:hypothetical protein